MSRPQNKINDIEYLLKEIKEVYQIVERSSQLIDKLDNPELKQIYIDETRPFINDHHNLRKHLTKTFEEHFEWERIGNAPRSLRYYRLYKEIVKDGKD